VAVAERQLQVLARDRRLIAHAGDFELFLETRGDTDDQIVDLGPRRAPKRTRAFGFITRIDLDLVVVQFDVDVFRNNEE